MSSWMAGLGAGLQSFGSSAMQYLAQEEERKRRDEERKIQQKIQNENILRTRRAEGYEDVGAIDRRFKVLQALSNPAGSSMDAMTFAGINSALAEQDRRSLEGAEDVTLMDGSTRRMALNPMRTPEARQMQQFQQQERARRDSALEEYKAKTTFESERMLAKRRGEYEALKRAGYIGGDEDFDPQRDYTTDVALARLQSTNQNRLDVAKTPRVSQSTTTRIGGSGGGRPGSAASLDPAQRAQLRTAESNLLNAEDEFQRMLGDRPEPDPMLTDEENAAKLQRWARGDSTFAANRMNRMQGELGAVRQELGVTPAAPPPAAGAPTYNTGAEGALAARAQMKIREIMASNHSAQEKQAMVQQVNAVLAQELRKLRGGR